MISHGNKKEEIKDGFVDCEAFQRQLFSYIGFPALNGRASLFFAKIV